MRGLDRRNLIARLGAALPILAGGAPATAQPAGPAKRVAFTVGVDSYRHLEALKRARSDARAVDARLAAIGYRTTVSLDPDRKRFDQDLERFVAQITPDTSAIFFYAGHGFQAGGANYLTSVDTSGNADALYPSSIPLAGLLERIAERRPRQGIVILDACREVPWTPGGPKQREGFASVIAPGGFYIAYAAGSGELALDRLGDDDPDPNSVFTRALLKQLSPDASIDAAVRAARSEVTCLAATVDHPQHPAIYDQMATEFSLRGEQIRVRAIPPGAGALPRTLALVIGHERAQGFLLRAPPHDVTLLTRVLGGLGAEVWPALNPPADDVLAMLDKAAASDAEQIVVYWSGNGFSAEGRQTTDAVFLTKIEETPGGKPRVSGVLLGEIARRLAKPGRRLAVLGDVCLDKVPAGEFQFAHAEREGRVERVGFALSQPRPKAGGPAWDDALGLLMRAVPDATKQQALGDIVALFATGYGAYADDVAEGYAHSPFANALANALARPGLSFREFASVVRDEVEDMTEARQSPLLVGTRAMARSIFVHPRACLAAARPVA